LDLQRGEVGPTEHVSAGPVGIYIHFPFCRHLCTYCDFDTFARREPLIEPYVDALVRQIRCSPRVTASTLYMGGGTPGLLLPEQAMRLMDACRDAFGLPEGAEATIEVNPSGIDLARLKGFREAGFNRLSVGVQSVDARLLRLLGRRHSREEARRSVQMAYDVGFRNVSVDLLYGVPFQDLPAWNRALEAVVEWGVEHVSAYMLTVEAGTSLERGVSRGILPMPAEDDVAAMYRAGCQRLSAAGYRRYEISNWARPGKESSHNLIYWRNQPYLGIGAGAAGSWHGGRYKITSDLDAYIQGTAAGRVPLAEDEAIDRRRAMSDTMILGLRLDEGVSTREFRRRFGVEPTAIFGDALTWAKRWGLLEWTTGRLRLTEQGVLLSNEVFERLL